MMKKHLLKTVSYALLSTQLLGMMPSHATKGPYILKGMDEAARLAAVTPQDVVADDTVDPLKDPLAEIKQFHKLSQALYSAPTFGEKRKAVKAIAEGMSQNIKGAFVEKYLMFIDELQCDEWSYLTFPMLPVWHSIGVDSTHPKAYDAVMALQRWRTNNAFALTAMRRIAQELNHPHAYDVAHMLWQRGDKKDKVIAREVLHRIAKETDHTKAYEAVMLLRSGDDKDKEIAREALRSIAKETDHTRAYEAVMLLRSGDDKDKEIAREVLRRIAKETNHINAYDAVILLHYDDEDKEIAREALLNIAQSPAHPHAYDAAHMLWQRDGKEDKVIAREVLRSIAQSPAHPEAYNAAKNLLTGDDEDKEIASKVLRSIAKEINHTKAYEAVMLLRSGDDEDKEIAYDTLQSIAQISTHLKAYEAIKELWYYSSRARDKEFAHKALHRIVRDLNHQNVLDSAKELRAGNADDKAIAREAFRRIAEHPAHPAAYAAAEVLSYYPLDEDKEFARKAFNSIAQGRKKPGDSLELLGNDEEVGTALLLFAGQGRLSAIDPACALLRRSNDEGVKVLARKALRRVAEYYPGYPGVFGAIKTLWLEGGAANKEFVRNALRDIAEEPYHQMSFDAAQLLFQNGDDGDKAWVREHIQTMFEIGHGPNNGLQDYISMLRARNDVDDKVWLRNHIQAMFDVDQEAYALRQRYKRMLLNSANMDDKIFAVGLEKGTGDAEALVNQIGANLALTPDEKKRYLEGIARRISELAFKHRASVINGRKFWLIDWAAEEAEYEAEQAEIAAREAENNAAAEAQAANPAAGAGDHVAEGAD